MAHPCRDWGQHDLVPASLLANGRHAEHQCRPRLLRGWRLDADLDASESKIKHVKVLGIEPLVPVAIGLNREFGHRGFLHSARGWAVWTLLILPLVWWIGWLPIVALAVGYASHLAGDACTRTGIPLRYPRQEKFQLLPAKLRFVTGSAVEEGVFVTFACLTLTLLLNAMTLSF